MILARAEIDYRIPAKYGDVLEVRIGLEKIGRTSFTYLYEVVDQAGRVDSALYGMFAARGKVAGQPLEEGGVLGEYFVRQPSDPYREYAIKWDGEWQVTYETFRDMGLAYAVGLVLMVFTAASAVLGENSVTNPFFGIVYVWWWVGLVPAFFHVQVTDVGLLRRVWV